MISYFRIGAVICLEHKLAILDINRETIRLSYLILAFIVVLDLCSEGIIQIEVLDINYRLGTKAQRRELNIRLDTG